MRKLFFILIIMLSATGIRAQQWNGATSTTGTIYRGGNVSIGTETSIPGWSTLYLSNSGGLNPTLVFKNGDAPVDNRVWAMMAQGGSFRILTELDNYAGAQDALHIARSGLNVTKVSFPNGNVILGGTTLMGSYGTNGVLQVQGNESALSLRSKSSTASFDAYLGATWFSLIAGNVPMFISTGNHPMHMTTNGIKRMSVTPDGKVGIGTESPDEKLSVKGKIHAEEVRVDLSVSWPRLRFRKKL